MRCCRCGHQFELVRTTLCSCPPGIPATPKEVMTVALVLSSLAASTYGLGWRPVAVWFAVPTIHVWISWIFNYLQWLFGEGDPYTNTKAGTCPRCHTRNRIWPWSD